MPCFAILSLHSNRQAPQAPAKQSGRWPPGVLAIWRRMQPRVWCQVPAVWTQPWPRARQHTLRVNDS